MDHGRARHRVEHGRGGPIPDYWHIEDTGDFTGDGRADILWRDDAGRVVLWEMDGATIVNNTLVADVATTSHIETTADFTGDGRTDILWHDDDGTIRLWEMNGATVVSDTTVATMPDTREFAGTGDFNHDNRADLLWRDDDGTVTLWEMDGATIIERDRARHAAGLLADRRRRRLHRRCQRTTSCGVTMPAPSCCGRWTARRSSTTRR